MVQKDQNRNEWKMPLELFGSFVRETWSKPGSSREDRDSVYGLRLSSLSKSVAGYISISIPIFFGGVHFISTYD